MDNNYRVPLAAILRKAHGCIYRGTDEFIDVGGEVSELRRICDSQRATISRLRYSLAAIIGIDADKPAETVAAMRYIARMALTPRATSSEERKP